ncbi:hypothetical protein OG2516_03528 [Oceanicola granulosus HTCC2516]|uniref:Integral membrane protein n=1 Tax=Oceanicola granulosus (strain ATCC BAA-861 / DSM 15982 / KCTC 12143 / HTCC2516) TaxID=314256 RepID=Q2CAI0_OCEGH|nr:phage holin family protein [Oceanicola granulosus]EAR49694.1 hypothetical protein OG2516_03528 [Oceanicola granulosus HTCC2516]
MTDKPHESTTSLVGDALQHVSSLVRSEVDLARAEIDQNLRRAGAAIGMIVAAGVIALTALNVLAGALVAAITEAGIDAGWSALIVGVLFAIIAYVLLKKGTNDLQLSSLAPTRTAENVKRDARAVQGAYNDK